MSEFEGKVALVTGASRGIGKATALELARRGAKVALTARSVAEVQATAEQIKQSGQAALALTLDLAGSASTVQSLVAEVSRELGAVDILVNNAAVAGPYGASWELDPAEWEAAITVNLVAPFFLQHAVLPAMLQKGWGRIINVSSGAARNPMARAGAYSVTKAGLDMMTRQLGDELAGSGVVAISLYPGIVDTAMQEEIRSQPTEKVGEAMSERFKGFYTSGQLQPPEQPARLIAALAGNAGANLNGQIVSIGDAAMQALISN